MKYLLILVLVIVSCNGKINYSKENHIYTHEITRGLYKERYCVYSGGVYGGDVYTIYLTDSISFRKYVGKTDDSQLFEIIAIQEGLDIFVFKTEKNVFDKIDTLEQKIYNISELKREGKWE